MFIYLIPPPKEPPLCYSLECFPTKHNVLDTVDQSANEMHDFAGHVFKTGKIIACALRDLKVPLEDKKETQ